MAAVRMSALRSRSTVLPLVLLAVLVAALAGIQLGSVLAFAAPSRPVVMNAHAAEAWGSSSPVPFSAGRSSASSATALRIFGLGTSEILVILAVGALFFGPETLKGFAKEAGKAAGDLKDVPKAFQDGMDIAETDKKDGNPQDAEVVEKKPAALKEADDKAK